jgi:hypothetical protein
MPTERMRVQFVAKQSGGEPWIAVETIQGPRLSILTTGFIGLELRKGTTPEKAGQIAEYLNENVASLSYTS